MWINGKPKERQINSGDLVFVSSEDGYVGGVGFYVHGNREKGYYVVGADGNQIGPMPAYHFACRISIWMACQVIKYLDMAGWGKVDKDTLSIRQFLRSMEDQDPDPISTLKRVDGKIFQFNYVGESDGSRRFTTRCTAHPGLQNDFMVAVSQIKMMILSESDVYDRLFNDLIEELKNEISKAETRAVIGKTLSAREDNTQREKQ